MPVLIAMIAIKGAAYAVRHMIKVRKVSRAEATKVVLKVAADKHNQIMQIKQRKPKVNKSVGVKALDNKPEPLTAAQKRLELARPQPRAKPAGKNNTTIQYGDKANLSSDAKIEQVKRIKKNKGTSVQEKNKNERAGVYLGKHDKAQIYKDTQKGVK